MKARPQQPAVAAEDAPALTLVPALPSVVVAPGEIPRMRTEAEQQLAELPYHEGVFRRNRLVRLTRETDLSPRTGVKLSLGALSIESVTEDWLALKLASVCQFVRRDGRTKRMARVDPPTALVKALLAAPDSSCLPELLAVVEHPTLRPDGTLIGAPGWDAPTGIVADFDAAKFGPMPHSPARAEAERAVQLLLEVISEFPFERPEHRMVALAMMITAVVRASLATAPAFGLTGPKMGSGKTLLARIVGWLQTGRDPALLSVPEKDEAEMRKRLFSAMLRAPGALIFDNIERPFSSESVCTFLTTPVWRERVLGSSRDLATSTNTLVAFTGNNLVLQGDLSTRALLCRIDPRVERPEEREFARDLPAYVLQHRPQLIIAALTILRAYIVAGRPRRQGSKPFGRFERWDELVRGALLWLDLADPVITRLEIEEADPVRERLIALLSAWHDALGNRRVTGSELIFEAASSQRLRNALAPFAEEKGTLVVRRLGYALRGYAGRIEGGFRLVATGRTEYGQSYAVEAIDAS